MESMPSWMLYLATALGALGFFVVAFLIIMSGTKQKRLQERISKIKERKPGKVASRLDPTAPSLRRKQEDDRLPLLGRLVRRLPIIAILRARLERAGLKMTAERFVMLCAALTLFITLLATLLLHKGILLGLFVGIIVGLGIPHVTVSILATKRIKRFIQLFPGAIDLIVRGLRSGLPVAESFKIVSSELEDPVGSIFNTISEQIKLGVTMENALLETARKLRCTEFNFFVTSIILQRETGGNLGEILNNLSDVLRKRLMMRLKIKALASEAKASAIIVGALPFVVMIVLLFISPGYLDPLWNDYRGNLCAGGAALSLLIGIGTMIKMSRFEI